MRGWVKWGRWLLLTQSCGKEPVVSPCQPGTVSATLPAIIIVFNLNDVASLEHTKYVGVLTYRGALRREGSKRRKEGWSGAWEGRKERI